jgi:flagellar basal body-associated protein FliL
MITVKCSCGKTYQVKNSYANKKAKCTCGKVLSVPDVSAEELDKSSEKISFSCTNCDKTFNVSKKFLGKKVRCKSCSTVQTVPLTSETSDEVKDFEAEPHDDKITDQQDIIQTGEDDHTEQEQEPEPHAQEQEVEISRSSEKPKRVLIICLIMVLLGAIAYGLFIYYSGQSEEEKQTPPSETTLKEIPEPIESSDQKQDEDKESTDENLEEKQATDNLQPEPLDSQQKTEAITPEQKSEALQSEAKKKIDASRDKQPEPEPAKSPEKEKKTDIHEPSTSTQPETIKDMNKQELTAAIDPKTLTEETEKRLRTTPMTYTKKQVTDMIQKYNFYEANYNPNGGFPNRFVDNRNGTITDNETLLMWQKSGTREMLSWKKAPEYIDRLNNRKFSGYADWRLPTLEELLTLTEPRHSRQGLYISSFFSQKQGIVATSDSCNYDGKNLPWYISFLRGISNCISYNLIDEFHVRAVRSMDRPDKQMHN